MITIFMSFSLFIAATASPLTEYAAKPEQLTKLEPGASVFPCPPTDCRAYSFQSVDWPQTADRKPWRHWLTVSTPPTKPASHMFVLISNGSTADPPPTAMHALNRALASQLPTLEIKMIPNQPLKFAGDTKKDRSEDGIIAKTWRQFLDGAPPEQLAQFPMTKASILAMRAIRTELIAAKALTSDAKFIVAGASKRGWISWLVAEQIPNEVSAVVPMVIDILNVIPSMQHHRKSLGEWSWVLQDYVDAKITDQLATFQFAGLVQQLDPYVGLENLTLPKFIVGAANDQFFVPDSSKFYRDRLKGWYGFAYQPNSGHNLDQSEFIDHIKKFVTAHIATKLPSPLQWEFADGIWHVTSTEPIRKATLWQANSAKSDFRLAKDFPAYQPKELKNDGKAITAQLTPAPGYTASFIEITTHSLTQTTPIEIHQNRGQN
jgi:PhoPQ-activated pathogenicity-related protein